MKERLETRIEYAKRMIAESVETTEIAYWQGVRDAFIIVLEIYNEGHR